MRLLNKLRRRKRRSLMPRASQEFQKHTGSNVCRCCIHSSNYIPGHPPHRGTQATGRRLAGRRLLRRIHLRMIKGRPERQARHR